MKGKLKIILPVLLLVLVGGGGAYKFLLSGGGSAKKAAPPKVAGELLPMLKENAVVRSIVTNDLTGLATDDLIQRPAREKLLTDILKDLQSETDEKVTHVFFTDVVVQ
jgi:flagellar basal body-associated protein FliL